jgi:endonuclease VIII
MPEGDSLHRAARRLQVLVGERVEAESPHPRGAATGVARAVDGRVLESVEAVGKNLLLRFEGGLTVRSHLRMSGRWRIGRRGPRRVGSPWLVLRSRDWEAAQWNGPVLSLGGGEALRRLGPDLLADDTDVAAVAERVRRGGAGRLLGEALLDQRLVSGLGNMWLAESLHRVGVSPWLPVEDATVDELRAALEEGRRLMRASVGGARPTRLVYRRAGRPCPRCGTPVRSRGLGEANRIAYWCPACQRGPVVPS